MLVEIKRLANFGCNMVGIIVPREFCPGEVIYREEPFLELLRTKFRDIACESCKEKAPNLKPCKECLIVKYCGKSCQKKHLKIHRLECKNLKNLPTENLNLVDIIRMIGNIILMIKGNDWKDIKSNILGAEVSFDDIDPRLEEITGSYHNNIRYAAMKEHVRKYTGDENMPNEEDFRKIYGKVSDKLCTSRIESGCETKTFIIGFSAIERECIPNCFLTEKGHTFMILALKKIEKGEKLSMNNQDFLFSPQAMEAISGSCKCSDCSLPYGESVLTRIEDEQRALDVIVKTHHFLNMWFFFPVVRKKLFMKVIVDDLLKKQEGVLGSTNELHLKVLAIKCFEIGGPPLEIKHNLLKLEKNLVSMFGEYFPPMKRIYDELSAVCFALGNITEGIIYINKIKEILMCERQ